MASVTDPTQVGDALPQSLGVQCQMPDVIEAACVALDARWRYAARRVHRIVDSERALPRRRDFGAGKLEGIARLSGVKGLAQRSRRPRESGLRLR